MLWTDFQFGKSSVLISISIHAAAEKILSRYELHLNLRTLESRAFYVIQALVRPVVEKSWKTRTPLRYVTFCYLGSLRGHNALEENPSDIPKGALDNSLV